MGSAWLLQSHYTPDWGSLGHFSFLHLVIESDPLSQAPVGLVQGEGLDPELDGDGQGFLVHSFFTGEPLDPSVELLKDLSVLSPVGVQVRIAQASHEGLFLAEVDFGVEAQSGEGTTDGTAAVLTGALEGVDKPVEKVRQ